MRWISRDPIGYEGGVNLYEYVGSNPVFYYDDTGREPRTDIRKDDPGDAETIRKLEEELRDPNTPQKRKSQIKKRLKELRRRKSKKQQHHRNSQVYECDDGHLDNSYDDLLLFFPYKYLKFPAPIPPRVPVPVPVG